MKTDGERDLGHGLIASQQTVASRTDSMAQEIFAKGDAVGGMKAAAELEAAESAVARDREYLDRKSVV